MGARTLWHVFRAPAPLRSGTPFVHTSDVQYKRSFWQKKQVKISSSSPLALGTMRTSSPHQGRGNQGVWIKVHGQGGQGRSHLAMVRLESLVRSMGLGHAFTASIPIKVRRTPPGRESYCRRYSGSEVSVEDAFRAWNLLSNCRGKHELQQEWCDLHIHTTKAD